MTQEAPLELPSELSDEAAAQLIECLYEFARYLESRYFAQLHRYYHPEDPRQQPLWRDEDAVF
jgi:hypothetical protein